MVQQKNPNGLTERDGVGRWLGDARVAELAAIVLSDLKWLSFGRLGLRVRLTADGGEAARGGCERDTREVEVAAIGGGVTRGGGSAVEGSA